MDFAFPDLVRITRATVVRWPHRALSLLPICDSYEGGPGRLFIPLYWRPVSDRALARLAAAGAAGAVLRADQQLPAGDAFPTLGILTLPEPYKAYYRLAREARRRSPGLVVGITGSAGKSSTKAYLATILRAHYQVHATPGSFNVSDNCAQTLMALCGSPDEAAVIEMGFGAIGHIDHMAAMARPCAGIITNVKPDHMDGAGDSVEAIAEEKARLGHHLQPGGVLALHHEDPGSASIRAQSFRARVLTFGEQPGADVIYRDVRCDEDGTALELSLFGRPLACRLRAHGAFQAANAAAAALVAHVAGMRPAEIRDGLAGTEPPPRRFAVHRFGRGLTLIDDTWHASLDAMLTGIANAARLAGPRRKIALLSDITKLGSCTKVYHRRIGAALVRHGYGHLLLFDGKHSHAIREGATAAGLPGDRIHLLAEAAEFPDRLFALIRPDTVVYCKAKQDLWIGPALDRFRRRLAAAGYEPLASP